MQKKFQIFVSSTYQDLIEERRAVIEAILDLGHIPIGMEAFQASNEEQWSYIKKRIDEADYYVVIVAERYGSTDEHGVSYTEMEYDYAREKGVPVAAFLLHEDARSEWRREKAEWIDDRKKVDTFRTKCQSLLVKYWQNRDNLANACTKSIVQMISAFPRDGWIPAREAIKPDVVNEITRLSEENGNLRSRINELEQESSQSARRDVDLLFSDLAHTPINVSHLAIILQNGAVLSVELPDKNHDWSISGQVAFASIYKKFVVGASIPEIEEELLRYFRFANGGHIQKTYIGNSEANQYSLHCILSGFHNIMELLILSGYVESTNEIYKFTEHGKK